MKKNIYKIVFSINLIFSIIGSSTNLGKAQNNKIYHVPVALWHSENSGRLSMGNGAVSQIARVEENGSTSTITVEFVPMQFMNMNGHLYSLSIYSGNLFSGGLYGASVIDTYQDYDLDGNVKNFPALLQFSRQTLKEDKIGVSVSVDAMDKVIGGDASQNAILKFYWDQATLISGNEETVKTEEQSSEKEEKTNEKSSNDNQSKDENKDNKTEEKSSDENSKKFVTKKVEDFFKEDMKTKENGVYNIDITAAYLNPLTGITADGGTKNIEIGEGMSQGVISPITTDFSNLDGALKNQKTSGEKRWSKAQLQRTKDGKLFATVRIHLMNWITRNKEQGPFIKVLQENGEYKLVDIKETNVHIEQFKDSYADYTFEVPRENFSAMIQMFVEPMNRPVRFFVEVNPSTIEKGGVDNMHIVEDTNKFSLKYLYYSLLLIMPLALFYIFKKKNNKLEG